MPWGVIDSPSRQNLTHPRAPELRRYAGEGDFRRPRRCRVATCLSNVIDTLSRHDLTRSRASNTQAGRKIVAGYQGGNEGKSVEVYECRQRQKGLEDEPKERARV